MSKRAILSKKKKKKKKPPTSRVLFKGNFVQNLIVVRDLLLLVFTEFFINIEPTLANLNQHRGFLTFAINEKADFCWLKT